MNCENRKIKIYFQTLVFLVGLLAVLGCYVVAHPSVVFLGYVPWSEYQSYTVK